MIFYFSATGNTLWAAQQLAENIGERLVFIPEAMDGPCHYTLAEGERIGFCFPVHAWRPPVLVRRFIQRLSFANAEDHYCFALCTAGDTTGESMRIFRQILAQRSLHLDAVYSLIMPESYVGLPFMDVDTIDKEREKKNYAKLSGWKQTAVCAVASVLRYAQQPTLKAERANAPHGNTTEAASLALPAIIIVRSTP